MTEQERKQLIEKMANAMFRSKEYNGCFKIMDMARAALAVAEPVIREQTDDALREENARLREALKPFADAANVGAYSPFWVSNSAVRAAAAAIREGGKDA